MISFSVEQLIIVAIITSGSSILVGLVVHLVTAKRVAERVIDRMNKEFVAKETCSTCQTNQKERRADLETWLRSIEDKFERFMERIEEKFEKLR